MIFMNKKIFSLLAVIVMVASLFTSAFAVVENESVDGNSLRGTFNDAFDLVPSPKVDQVA